MKRVRPTDITTLEQVRYAIYKEFGTESVLRANNTKLFSKHSLEDIFNFIDIVYNNYFKVMFLENGQELEDVERDIKDFIISKQDSFNSLRSSKIKKLDLTEEEALEVMRAPIITSLKMSNFDTISSLIATNGLSPLKDEYKLSRFTKTEFISNIRILMPIIVAGLIEILFTSISKDKSMEESIKMAKDRFMYALPIQRREIATGYENGDTVWFKINPFAVKYSFVRLQSDLVYKLNPFNAPESASTLFGLFLEAGANMKLVQQAYLEYSEQANESIKRQQEENQARMEKVEKEAEGAIKELNTALTDNLKPFLLNAFTKAIMSNPSGISETDVDEIARAFKEIRIDILNNPGTNNS